MHTNLLKKAGAISLAAAMALCAVPYSAFAAGTGAPGETDSSKSDNNRKAQNDLGDHDTIDVNAKGSLHIYKYDTTSAEAADVYHEGDIKATGQEDTKVSDKLKDFAIQGVEFTYLKVGDIETYSKTDASTDTGSQVVVVYEIPTKLQQILNSTGQLPATGACPADGGNGPYVMTAANNVATPCSKTGVLHYDSTQLSNALKAILDSDNITAKNALESYLTDYKTEATDDDDVAVNEAAGAEAVTGKLVTDKKGEAKAENLPLGLYLIVETRVPEEVTSTVNPWLVTLPFTNTVVDNGPDAKHGGSNSKTGNEALTNDGGTPSGGTTDSNVGGDYWLYNFYAYPKNQTGNPTVDKSVRNSYNTETISENKGRKNDGVDSADSYTSALAGITAASLEGNIQNEAKKNVTKPIVVYNSSDGKNTADTSDAAYVANRGGYTVNNQQSGGGANYSKDFAYGDITTASEGDVLDYIIVSKLPHITSKATYLSQYTFTDTLGKGITYNNDPRIAIYNNKDDAAVNNTKNAVEIWEYSENNNTTPSTPTGYFGKNYVEITRDSTKTGETRLIVSMTENGLKRINHEENDASSNSVTDPNKGLSDYYMVLYYTATLESNDQVTLGDNGNQNDVQLTWSRTNNDFYNSLQDRNYVYSYGVDLTKTLAGTGGDLSKVQFKLYNTTDAYYIIAQEDATTKGLYNVTGKTKSKAEATTLIPNPETGKIFVKGLEADKYDLTEVKTDDGYTLLKDQIVIDIKGTERDVKASVAGTVGLTEANAQNIIQNYGTGIKNEDGQLVNAAKTDVTANSPKGQDANQSIDRVVAPGEANSEIDNSGGGTTANGRTIGKTDMYVGAINKATATVDGKDCKMLNSSTGDTESENAEVKMSVLNQKNWTLPQTGGAGLWAVTILGVLALAGGVAMNRKKKVA